MGTVRAYQAVDLITPTIFYGNLVSYDGSHITISDGINSGTYFGSFTFSNVGLTGGTVTGYDSYRNGVLQATYRDGSFDALTVNGYLSGGNAVGLFTYVLQYADTIYGSVSNDRLRGYGGDDAIIAGEGVDTLQGDGGADFLDGGTGNDQMYGNAGNDTYVVDATGDTVIESVNGGTDTIQANVTYTLPVNVENLTLTGSGATNGTGNALTNVIVGNANNNVLDGGTGADTLNGDAGTDTVSYADAIAGITARLDLGFGADVGGALDTYTGLENATGSSFNDVLVGAAGVVNTLDGGEGDDTLYGEGLDSLNGGAGNDVLFGYLGNALNLNLATLGIETVWGGFLGDTLDGSTATSALVLIGQGPSAETMLGGAGGDFVYYRAGDVISGGVGNDWAVATLSSTGVNLNLNTSGFENSWGSPFDDVLTGAGATGTVVLVGDTGNDALTGGSVGDFLYGFAGNDTLTGGAGNDNMVAGEGNDIFAYNSPGWGVDLVWDFTPGQDKIGMAGSGFGAFNQLNIGLVGAHSVVGMGAPDQIWVLGVAGLAASDFIF